MLETLNLRSRLDKQEYRARVATAQRRLLQLQHACWAARVPSLIVFEGWEATFRANVLNKLTQRLEPRGFSLHAIQPPRTFEAEMPWMWRFWVRLPAHGEMGLFDRSWYTRVLRERVEGTATDVQWRNAFDDINGFERMLADDRLLVAKFFLHADRKTMGRRLKKLKSNPLTRWQVTEEDRRHYRSYDAYLEAIEAMLARTQTEWAPWTLIEAADRRWATCRVFDEVIARLERGLRDQGLEVPELEADRSAENGNGSDDDEIEEEDPDAGDDVGGDVGDETEHATENEAGAGNEAPSLDDPAGENPGGARDA